MILNELLLPAISSFLIESINMMDYVHKIVMEKVIPKDNAVYMSLILLECQIKQILKALNMIVKQLE